MENNQNFYPPQQNWNQPMPPKKSNSGWVKWVIIGLLVIGLITALIISVANMGKKFGHVMNDMSQNVFTKSDSVQAIEMRMDYDSVYAMLARDHDASMKSIIDDLKNSSDSIIDMINEYQNGFNDSIRGVDALQRFTPDLSSRYFIKTGRATKLKNILLSYRANQFHNLPPSDQDSLILSDIVIDEPSKSAPGFLKKFASWENINFNQAPMNVNIIFRSMKTQVRTFEDDILSHYKKIITASENSGLIIIGPNGDTMK